MRKWANLTNAGELSIEKVLIELDIPLLFVCVDKSGERYLVMCIDDEELEYLFVQIDKFDLIRFLSTGRGLKTLFIKAGKKIRRVVLTESLNDLIIAKSKIKADMLPQKNVKYDFSDNGIVEYLRKLRLDVPHIKISSHKAVIVGDLIKADPAYHPKGIMGKSRKVAAAKKAGILGERYDKKMNSENKQVKKAKGRRA